MLNGYVDHPRHKKAVLYKGLAISNASDLGQLLLNGNPKVLVNEDGSVRDDQKKANEIVAALRADFDATYGKGFCARMNNAS